MRAILTAALIVPRGILPRRPPLRGPGAVGLRSRSGLLRRLAFGDPYRPLTQEKRKRLRRIFWSLASGGRVPSPRTPLPSSLFREDQRTPATRSLDHAVEQRGTPAPFEPSRRTVPPGILESRQLLPDLVGHPQSTTDPVPHIPWNTCRRAQRPGNPGGLPSAVEYQKARNASISVIMAYHLAQHPGG